MAPEEHLKIEANLELYNSILEEGCFFCDSKQQDFQKNTQFDYEHDHCIDICSDSSSS